MSRLRFLPQEEEAFSNGEVLNKKLHLPLRYGAFIL